TDLLGPILVIIVQGERGSLIILTIGATAADPEPG
ncbi:MAG: hypothetical protein RLZZ141_1566, partial [Pseudomonadota bacterium]